MSTLQVNISDEVCTTNAHLSCWVLDEGGGDRHQVVVAFQHCQHWAVVVTRWLVVGSVQ